MKREIDIRNFCGLARTLITICNIASMGKNFQSSKNRLINKPLEPGQFLSGEETLEKVLQIYVSGGQTFSEMGPFLGDFSPSHQHSSPFPIVII